MKAIKCVLVVMGATLITFGFGGTLMAFHSGGVANCDGCHTMHNSKDGVVESETVSGALLKGADVSSVCLNCHHWDGTGSLLFYHVSTPNGSKFSPGGDFYWLTKTYTWTEFGTQHVSEGDDHGHNIISADFGYTQDIKLATSPGGGYPSNQLGCSSCHDPHGKKPGKTGPISVSGSYGDTPPAGTVAGNYRLLGDVGYDAGALTFNKPVPTARTFVNGSESDSLHTDYGSGMSQWCGQCHGDLLGGIKHKVDVNLGGTLSGNYNEYVKTGDLTGVKATAYLALVPFERTSGTALNANSTAGPESNDQVMCLTCHRAHASAFQNVTRWDMSTEFPVTGSHPKAGDGGLGANDVNNSYYGRNMVFQFGNLQRSFCNKCHQKD